MSLFKVLCKKESYDVNDPQKEFKEELGEGFDSPIILLKIPRILKKNVAKEIFSAVLIRLNELNRADHSELTKMEKVICQEFVDLNTKFEINAEREYGAPRSLSFSWDTPNDFDYLLINKHATEYYLSLIAKREPPSEIFNESVREVMQKKSTFCKKVMSSVDDYLAQYDEFVLFVDKYNYKKIQK